MKAARTPKARFTPEELAMLHRAQDRVHQSVAQLAGMAETLDRAARDIKWFASIIDGIVATASTRGAGGAR